MDPETEWKIHLEKVLKDEDNKHDEDPEKEKESELSFYRMRRGTYISLNRILKYNLIFKKNVYDHARRQATKKLLNNFEKSDFHTLLTEELKRNFDRIYTLERITRYRGIKMSIVHEKVLKKYGLEEIELLPKEN